MTILQIALDLTDLPRALRICGQALRAGFDWVEVGTPLIKASGTRGIMALRRNFPDATIVADMKIMDAGRLESEIATKAGANIVTCLGVASSRTIREAARAAHSLGGRLMLDLINHPLASRRAREAKRLGVDYVLVHVGKDEQLGRRSPLADLERVARSTDLPIAVAGGLNVRKAILAVRKGASVVIVGAAITHAKDVMRTARDYVRALKPESQRNESRRV